MLSMPGGAQTRVKNGVAWRIGSERDIQWISNRTGSGRRITAAIPRVFADYATLVHPGDPDVPRLIALDRSRERHGGG
jgi:hypothetical protein